MNLNIFSTSPMVLSHSHVCFCCCLVCITFILCVFVAAMDCGHFANLRAARAQEIQWSSTYQRTDGSIPDNCRQLLSLGKIQKPLMEVAPTSSFQ